MLYICATPIGNLQDVTLRVLDALRSCDLVACEDTRHTKILLERHGISARLASFHAHNEEQRLNLILPLLREGKDVAAVSDAGMPGLSDPGFSLVRACVAEGLPLTVLPGPSAATTALVLSGLPADRFAFVGFLGRSRERLIRQLMAFEGTGAAVVAFESPRRVRSSLGVIAERWPERKMALCREITKIHEEVLRGTGAEILEALGEKVRGEIVLVLEASPSPVSGGGAEDVRGGASSSRMGPNGVAVAGGQPLAIVNADIERRASAALAKLRAAGVGTKIAAGIVSDLTGLPAKKAYDLAIEEGPRQGA